MPTDPITEALRFANSVSNVSGGLVTSTIEQRTDRSFAYNRRLARIAERAGFDYTLSKVRYTARYGAEYQYESTSFGLAPLPATERLKLIAAVAPRALASRRAREVGRHRRPPFRGAESRSMSRSMSSRTGSGTSSANSASPGSSTTNATAAAPSSSAR